MATLQRIHPDAVGLPVSFWQQWFNHPEKVWLRNALFQVHFWGGAVAATYVFIMSVSGSLIVYRDELFSFGLSVEPLISLHANLLGGEQGRFVNGIGAICLTLLSLTGGIIWWPGIRHWRRSVKIEWRANCARVNWDLHSALGFWWFAFVLMWGVSGTYLVFQDQFVMGLLLDPSGNVADSLVQLHFGRLSWFTKAVWVLVGLVPAMLAFTGMFMWGRRVMLKSRRILSDWGNFCRHFWAWRERAKGTSRREGCLGTTWEQLRPNISENGGVGPTRKQDESTT